MRFHTFHDVPPRPALQPYVRSFRAVRVDDAVRPPEPPAIRIPPDGAGFVLVRIDAAGLAPPDGASRSAGAVQAGAVRATVVGPRSTYSDVPLFPETLTIAVRLRPGALHALRARPAAELVDERHPLADVLAEPPGDGPSRDAPGGGLLDTLRPRLAAAPTLSGRLAVLRAFFTARFARAEAPNATVAAAIRAFGASPSDAVGTTADAVGVSTRHLRTLFRRHVGLAPKPFARITRLHRVIQAFRRRPGADWAALALEAGFYDQSHLVADFHALLGETPTAFRTRDLHAQPARAHSAESAKSADSAGGADRGSSRTALSC